ncbi:MAG: 3-deoxy-manno-octulosonate cytidylyltransferase [Vicingaceae bacterium]
MRIAGIIPARYASSRLPGKPLKLIGDTSLVMRVFQQASKSKSLTEVFVATDDKRIFDHVTENGGKALLTSAKHQSGTERCNEAVRLMSQEFDYVINIQGDEPFIDPEQIDQLASICDGQTQIATLVKQITEIGELEDAHIPKVVLTDDDSAIYFSRSPVPYFRGKKLSDWPGSGSYYKHIGIYAYRKDILATISELQPSRIEIMEQLEQLRWLSNGFKIRTMKTELEGISVDTEEDLNRAIQFLSVFEKG